MPPGVRLENSMENELNQAPSSGSPDEGQVSANVTSPNGSPNGNPNGSANQGGGGGRRRRRRRKKGGSGGGAQAANGNGGGQQTQSQGPRREFRGDRQPNFDRQQGGQSGGGGKRRKRGRTGRGGGRQPFVGPMDHNYRATNEVNGNIDPSYRRSQGRSNGKYSVPSHYEEPQLEPVNQPEGAPTRIFCFIEDLFFVAKINETAKKLGVKVEFAKTPEPVLERGEDDVPEEERPALVIMDLNNNNIKPLTLAPKIRAKFKKTISIVGFLNHLQGDLKLKAQEAGFDMVVPRSAFSQNLPNMIRRYGSDDEENDQQPM
jgi:CheY-like chemotaxis protein